MTKIILHIVIIGALPESLINFRGELIKSMVACGYKVTVMSAPAEDELLEKIKGLGVDFISFPVARNGQNPFADLKTLCALCKTMKQIKPDMVFSYTIKPVIWGGIASRLMGVRFNALITGLGFAFQGNSFKRKLLSNLVSFLYRTALKNADSVIFQNPDNRAVFTDRDIVSKEKTYVVAGSGVDSQHYLFSELPKEGFTFLCVARLLGEKGLREYVKAARIVKQMYPSINFHLVGPEDTSPDGIGLEEVGTWQASGLINYYGSVSDVRSYVNNCHVYVLPSYHEGMPRSVLEAMSMGRPILTTDAVGCRETVENGINGYKVPVGNHELLAERMIWFIDNQDKLSMMGIKSRAMIEQRFDVKTVNADILKIMKLGAVC